MDEIYINVKGQWKGYDRNVDTVDFLLAVKHDNKSALHFFKKIIGHNGKPPAWLIWIKIVRIKRELTNLTKDNNKSIELVSVNTWNVIEQNHRYIKPLSETC